MRSCRRFVPHLHLACFKNAVGEEILDKILQTLTAGVHVAQNLSLLLVHRARLSRSAEVRCTRSKLRAEFSDRGRRKPGRLSFVGIARELRQFLKKFLLDWFVQRPVIS